MDQGSDRSPSKSRNKWSLGEPCYKETQNSCSQFRPRQKWAMIKMMSNQSMKLRINEEQQKVNTFKLLVHISLFPSTREFMYKIILEIYDLSMCNKKN